MRLLLQILPLDKGMSLEWCLLRNNQSPQNLISTPWCLRGGALSWLEPCVTLFLEGPVLYLQANLWKRLFPQTLHTCLLS